MNEVLAATVQQKEDALVTTASLELEGSQTIAPSNSPYLQVETSPLLVTSLLDLPFFGTLPVGHSLAEFIVSSRHQKMGHSPSSTPAD